MEFNPHLKLPFEEFIEKNEKLMHYIAMRYKKRAIVLGIDYEDLLSLASIGMINAYRKFDPTKFEKPIAFSTYAVPLMKGEILRFIRDKGHVINFPRRIKEIAWKIKELELESEDPEVLVSKLQEHLPRHELNLNMIHDAIIFLETSLLASLDKDLNIDGDDDSFSLSNFVGKEDDYSSLFVEDFLSTLSFNEKETILMRMNGASQRDIGKKLGISQVQASRNLRKIGAKLTRYKMEEQLDMNYTPQDKEEAIRLLRETVKSYAEISKLTGIPFSTVGKLGQEYRSKEVRKKNISVTASKRRGKPQRKLYQYDEAQVIALVEEGKMSYKEISEITGAPTGSITGIVRNAKIKQSEEKMNVQSNAWQASETGISRRESSNGYESYGEDISRRDVIKELEELLYKLKEDEVEKVSFSLSIQAKKAAQGVS